MPPRSPREWIPYARARAAAASAFATLCGPGVAKLADRRQPPAAEGVVDEVAAFDRHARRRSKPNVTAGAPGAQRDHAQGRRRCRRRPCRRLRPPHPGLGSGVGLHRAVPIEMVRRQVEDRRRLRRERRGAVQLEARQLDREHVERRRAAASTSGAPILPAVAAAAPAAARIAPSIWVVVVLPLVPVTASQACAGRAQPPGELDLAPDRDAGAAAAAAAAWSGRSPGEVTTSPVPAGGSARDRRRE